MDMIVAGYDLEFKMGWPCAYECMKKPSSSKHARKIQRRQPNGVFILKNSLVRSLILLAGVCATGEVAAQQPTSPTMITKLRTGWSDDVFTLETSGVVINPANCPSADAYASPVGIAAPGYKTFLSAALAAYSAGKQVTIIVSTSSCNQSRPAIVGIYLL